MGAGIDYGRGQTNIDHATGIRFGVIPMNALHEWAHESFDGIYPASCPECGCDVVDYSDIPEEKQEAADGWARKPGRCDDYACISCERVYGTEDVHAEEAAGWDCTDPEYKAHQFGDDSDIFIERAPFYTLARFCSPCAPGACYLLNPDPDGERAYCFGPDWFADDAPPYPVWDVKTGELVYEPEGEDWSEPPATDETRAYGPNGAPESQQGEYR